MLRKISVEEPQFYRNV